MAKRGRLKKTKKSMNDLHKWYNNQPETVRWLIMLMGIVVIIFGLMYLDIPSSGGNLPSIFDNKGSGSIWDMESSVPKLLSYHKLTENPVSYGDILCNTLYEQGLNITAFAKTVCYRPEYYNLTGTDYDCVCMMSV